ncbi:MAG: MFS transporter, partial [Kiritimatiellae bacterium]|nr:MFS transporter [Kiritimatiellia bacterium]
MKSTEQQVALEATPADGTRGRIAEIWLTVLCCAIYFTSYMTRKGYDASILAICEDTGLARTALGLASTAAVAVYGTGQFVTGFLADRFDSRRLIFIALLITAACNASMTFIVGCIPAMVALWAVNGFAQAMFWPPLIKIVAANLKGEAYSRGVFWISVASNCAIIMVFVLVSSCIRFAGWRLSFWIVSAMAVAMAAKRSGESCFFSLRKSISPSVWSGTRWMCACGTSMPRTATPTRLHGTAARTAFATRAA